MCVCVCVCARVGEGGGAAGKERFEAFCVGFVLYDTKIRHSGRLFT